MEFDLAKFKEAIVYFCHKAREKPDCLGKTKLNKSLWYSDAMSYALFGHPVTGERYVKHQFGPVPSHMKPTLRELQEKGDIVVADTLYFGRPKFEFKALREPRLDLFSETDLAAMDASFEHVCEKHTAKSISEQTHTDSWEMAAIGEEIPYFAFLVDEPDEITPEDVEWACREIAADKA